MEALGGLTIAAIVVGIAWILVPFILMGTNRRLDTLILTQQKMLRIMAKQFEPSEETTYKEEEIGSEIVIRAKTDEPWNVRLQVIKKFNISDQEYDKICRNLWQSKQIRSNIYYSLTKK